MIYFGWMEIGYDGCKTDPVFIRIPRLPLQRSKYKYTEYPVSDKYNESIYIYIYCWINVTDNGLFHIRYRCRSDPMGPPISKCRIIFDTPLLHFQLEISIDCKNESIQPSTSQVWLAYTNILESGTYWIYSGASSHPSGRFIPGWGHAGHSTVHSPSRVDVMPAGSWPRPARFSIFKWRQMRITGRNWL